jgi:hypothetical protein
MANKTIRVVTRGADGTMRTKDFENFDSISELHDQVGIDDCSTDLSLRGLPIFKGLVGPMTESKTVVRYESPDVFEALTKEWSKQKVRRRRRRKATEAEATEGEVTEQETARSVPAPNFSTGVNIPTPGTPSTL